MVNAHHTLENFVLLSCVLKIKHHHDESIFFHTTHALPRTPRAPIWVPVQYYAFCKTIWIFRYLLFCVCVPKLLLQKYLEKKEAQTNQMPRRKNGHCVGLTSKYVLCLCLRARMFTRWRNNIHFGEFYLDRLRKAQFPLSQLLELRCLLQKRNCNR